MEDYFKKAADIINNSKSLIALTGAGISVDSGIPDFRSSCGLWTKYDPAEYAHIDAFKKNPEKVWRMIFELMDIIFNAKPNTAHHILAKMEKMDLLKYVITQNIDNLHQEAGNRHVIEFHGNSRILECIKCKTIYRSTEIDIQRGIPPKCSLCNRILKPGVVFFGEAIPVRALQEAEKLVNRADAILVIGTSAVIYPASNIPYMVKSKGASVIEMNLESTGLTYSVTDVFIQGAAATVLPKLMERIS